MESKIKTAVIESSWGEAVINSETGEIITIDPELQKEYNVEKFDVAEWKAYQTTVLNTPCWEITDGLDILEIGIYHLNGDYTPADKQTRTHLYTQI